MVSNSERLRAGLLVLALGLVLVVGLAPFITGLLAIPILYVILEPVQRRLAARLPVRIAAALTTALALVILVAPALGFMALMLDQAQDIAAQVASGQLTARLQTLRLGPFSVGASLAGVGDAALAWLGGSAVGIIGSATRQALNLVIALFGLYHLLHRPGEVWTAFSRHLPFSSQTVERLHERFRNVTASTVVGTGLVALIQGGLVGAGLWAASIPNALFWSLVTVVLSILPIVGGGLIWGPAAAWLLVNGRPAAAVALALWGLLIVGNVDFFIRPSVSRRWAHVHPVTTLVGALAGVQYLGLVGLLIGPLALSYFFELLNAYRNEYGDAAEPTPAAQTATARNA